MTQPTPLERYAAHDPALYLKLEYVHPSGSIKHRSIVPFLEMLVATGELAAGARVVILSAGAAAVTAAFAGARLGLRVEAVLPTASPGVRNLVTWLGGTPHVVPVTEARALVQRLTEAPNSYLLAQAEEARLVDHYRAILREIVDQLGAPPAAVVVGLGTGLSAMGIAREARERFPGCAVYGVEPAEAAVTAGRPWAPHEITGLTPPIARPLLDRSLLADVLFVHSADAARHAREVARSTGLVVGASSGACVAAAAALRSRNVAGPIVVVCASSIHESLDVLRSEALV